MKPGLCKNCGRQNDDHAKFCHACGSLLSAPASVTGHHTIHDPDRLEVLRHELSGLMDNWKELIWEICARLEEIASLYEGKMGQDALQLAEQLKNDLFLQDAEQLLDNLKGVLAALQEMDNLAPDVFSCGGSYRGSSSKPERVMDLQEESLPEPEDRTELNTFWDQLQMAEDDDDIFGADVFPSGSTVPVVPAVDASVAPEFGGEILIDCDGDGRVDAGPAFSMNDVPVMANAALQLPERPEPVRMPRPEPPAIAPTAGKRSFFSSLFSGGRKHKGKGKPVPSPAAPAEEKCTVDQVYFSALTDALVRPGDYYTLRLFMGREEHRQIIEKIKQTAEKQLREDKTDIGVGVRKNQQVRVRITSAVAVIDDNEMTLPWTGDIREFSFMYFVPENVPGKTLPMTAHIYVDDVIATRLQICVPLGQQGGQVSFSRQDVKEAFMSYSSKDREEVLTFVQGLSRSRPDLNIFLDVKSLRSGQDWQEKLSRKIDACQVLYLCWSRAAKESEVVDYEWRHAFNTKGPEAIEPVPLEPPQLCAPPKELNNLHFNDLYMMLRLAEKKVQELVQEDKKE